MKKRKIKARKGMTLIEVVMSVALLAILLIPLANMAINASNTNKDAEIKQEASQVGQSIIEELTNDNEITVVSNKASFSNGQLTYNKDDDSKILSGSFTNIKQDKSEYNAKITCAKTENGSFSDVSGTSLEDYITNNSIFTEGIIKVSDYDLTSNKYSFTKVKYTSDAGLKEDNTTKIVKENDTDKFVLKVNKNAYYLYKEDASVSDDDDSVPRDYFRGSVVNTSADKINIVILLPSDLKEDSIPLIPLKVENNLGHGKKVNVIIWQEKETTGQVKIERNNTKGIVETTEALETGDINLGSLYEITVEVTKKGDDSNVLYTTKATKNIKFIS